MFRAWVERVRDDNARLPGPLSVLQKLHGLEASSPRVCPNAATTLIRSFNSLLIGLPVVSTRQSSLRTTENRLKFFAMPLLGLRKGRSSLPTPVTTTSNDISWFLIHVCSAVRIGLTFKGSVGSLHLPGTAWGDFLICRTFLAIEKNSK